MNKQFISNSHPAKAGFFSFMANLLENAYYVAPLEMSIGHTEHLYALATDHSPDCGECSDPARLVLHIIDHKGQNWFQLFCLTHAPQVFLAMARKAGKL